MVHELLFELACRDTVQFNWFDQTYPKLSVCVTCWRFFYRHPPYRSHETETSHWMMLKSFYRIASLNVPTLYVTTSESKLTLVSWMLCWPAKMTSVSGPRPLELSNYPLYSSPEALLRHTFQTKVTRLFYIIESMKILWYLVIPFDLDVPYHISISRTVSPVTDRR